MAARSTSLRPNRQNSRNPARCQETTVSGWTMIEASDQRSHNRRSTIQNHRSWGSSLGRGCFRLKTASCWRKATKRLPARVCGVARRRHAGKRLLHRPRSPSSDLSRRHRQAKCCQCSRLTFYRDDILMTHRSVRSTRSYEDQPFAALTEKNHWPYGPGDRASSGDFLAVGTRHGLFRPNRGHAYFCPPSKCFSAGSPM